jgi:uncharacterized protein (DUF2141 family)
MKMGLKIMLAVLILVVFTAKHLAQNSSEVSVKQGELTLNITGFENDDGTVKIALSNSKEDYTKKGKAYRAESAPIQNKSAQWKFEDLPFGTYAIKIFHDVNNNGELDTNFLGIPSENYGFSNNATGSFGPASWEDALFNFDKDSMVVEINMD